jgi:beta-glucosidase/6-phospho-beta-glucosidase/beta-galactosidase
MVQAARSTRTQVIWDLCHYGWPDDLDIFSPEFVRRFAAFVKAVVRFICSECDSTIFLAPINEISFFAWAGGESAYLNPFEIERAPELKDQLVRAAIEAIEVAWSINPAIRIVHTDPLINVVHNLDRPEEFQTAEFYRLRMFEAWDMLAGRQRPELGGHEKYLDIIGVNYYSNNQWLCDETSFHPERWLETSDKQYRPLSSLLTEVYNRYQRPIFIGETGTEGTERPGWLRYVCEEVRAAMRDGVLIEGICLYPIIDFPGWDDDRHCETGLWGFADENGHREVYLPLAEELSRQQEELSQLRQSPRHDYSRSEVSIISR